MIELLLAFLLLGSALLLQTTVVIHIQMLYGVADLVLLTLLGWTLHKNVRGQLLWAGIAGLLVGAASHQPAWISVVGYLLIMVFAMFLQNRIWDVELLTLFTTIVTGSFLLQGLTLGFRLFEGTPIPTGEAFRLIILPSVILNILFILPIYGFLGEFTKVLYPLEVEP